MQGETLRGAVAKQARQGLGVADQGREVLGAEQQIAAPAPLLPEQPLQCLEAAGLQVPGQVACRRACRYVLAVLWGPACRCRVRSGGRNGPGLMNTATGLRRA
jgi:hypothetical protein